MNKVFIRIISNILIINTSVKLTFPKKSIYNIYLKNNLKKQKGEKL